MFRVIGQGRDQGQVIPWSLILKECHPHKAADEPRAREYWKHEALACQSSLLDGAAIPLRPAHCFGVHQEDETIVWLALEDIQIRQPQPWTGNHFAQAAEHLGQFNGHFMHELPNTLCHRDAFVRNLFLQQGLNREH